MQTKKRTRFIRKYAQRFEEETREKRERRWDRIGKAFGETRNFVFLSLSVVAICFFWSARIARPYLTSPEALGKDYFAHLTLAKFISDYLPFPPTGWVPFSNAGVPLVAGQSFLFFYLMYPLTKIFDLATSLELASALSILFFLIASHLLFYLLSKSHIFSLLLTTALSLTPATYKLLAFDADFAAVSIQWYLPIVFLLTNLFLTNPKRYLLILAALITGLAITTQAPLALTAIYLPASLYLVTAPMILAKTNRTHKKPSQQKSSWTPIGKRLADLLLFTLISFVVGSTGIYAAYSNYIARTPLSPCSSDICLLTSKDLSWFSPLILTILAPLLPATLIALGKGRKLFRETASLLITLFPLLLAITIIHLQVIDTYPDAVVPANLFWAISFLALTAAARALHSINLSSRKLAIATISVALLLIAISLPLLPKAISFKITDASAKALSHPSTTENYIIPKYQTLPAADVIPDWLPLEERNERIDSLTQEFASWWNFASQMPTTRGFKTTTSQELANWQHYLQYTTAPPNPQETISETTRVNRALFMLDAFGVGFIQHPHESIAYEGIGYNPSLLADPRIAKKRQTVIDSTFVELNADLVTPIIVPTNAARVLVISDAGGYETFVRATSLLNLNSKSLITIQGPQSIDSLESALLTQVDALILYQFRGSDWSQIEEFINNGGNVFIDISSKDYRQEFLPGFLGSPKLIFFEKERQWSLKHTESELLQGVEIANFSPLLYGKDPWKLAGLSTAEPLASWVQPILVQNHSPILVQGKIDSASIIFSGFNLPFHLVSYGNDTELTLFQNILDELVEIPTPIGPFSVDRPTPSSITVSATNARGIYFKENHHPGWTARINGQRASIYEAGLGFMYIPIHRDLMRQTNQVRIEFRGDPVTWGLPLLSLAGALFAILISLTTAPLAALSRLFAARIYQPLQKWWNKEE